MKRTNSYIKTNEVIDYWLKSNENIFINKPSIETKLILREETCFCCGDHRGNLEKAHIIPVSSGGSDNVNNIHILCKPCHLRTEAFSDLPIIGKELYFNFIKKHPELCILRENILIELIEENIDLLKNNINFQEKPKKDIQIEIKPTLSNLKYYEKELRYWKKERNKFLDIIVKDKPKDFDIKYKMNLVRTEIKKYEDLIKIEKTE